MRSTMSTATDSPDVHERVSALAWAETSTHLDAFGWAMLEGMLSADECRDIAELYDDDANFRDRKSVV